jgi:DNA topoisomerase IB
VDLPVSGWPLSKQPGVTQRVASNIATVRAFREVRKARSTSMWSHLQRPAFHSGNSTRAHGIARSAREKVIATVVHLLETTLIRVGNDDYARQNNSYGLTTLKNRHVAIEGNEIRFRFTGKGGKQSSLRVRDRRLAKFIRACQELPGQELLQYIDEQGNCQGVTSTDVNEYLKAITVKTLRQRISEPWRGRCWRPWP